eukprot:GCRY01004398.1.p1 GENE.GCRY01004398.1~~GCRY01004398.1.p1  ORF type:complete len:487 (-),score=81.37 GCRY01004398.1:114-1574(-)
MNVYHLPFVSESWNGVKELISQPFTSFPSLANVIRGFQRQFHPKYRFNEVPGVLLPSLKTAIDYFGNSLFFEKILPSIQKSAVDCPNLFSNCRTLPILETHSSLEVSFFRTQAHSLLSLAFFCALPPAEEDTALHQRGRRGDISFFPFYDGDPEFQEGPERVKCLLSYFKDCVFHHQFLFHSDHPEALTFKRNSVKLPNVAEQNGEGVDNKESKTEFDARAIMDNLLIEKRKSALCPVSLSHRKPIEASHATGHVDFANRFLQIFQNIPSCTQEEVLFSIRPELYLGLLFCAVMAPTDSIVISGARQFCGYSGYLSTFRYQGSLFPHPSATPSPDTLPLQLKDPANVIAIDAMMVSQSHAQFVFPGLVRDICKAYAGFSLSAELNKRRNVGVVSVSTGDWGCGVFNGDPALKFCQQVLAASLAGVEAVDYAVWGDATRYAQIEKLAAAFSKLCCGDLYQLLFVFAGEVEAKTASPSSFVSFICANV